MFNFAIEDEMAFGRMARIARVLGYKSIQSCAFRDESAIESDQCWSHPRLWWTAGIQTTDFDGIVRQFSFASVYETFGLEPNSRGEVFKPPAKLAYCRHCAEEHVAQFGVATWLRSHNIFGVATCFRHPCTLEAVSLPSPFRAALPGDLTGAHLRGHRRSRQVDQRTAKFVAALVRTEVGPLDLEGLTSMVLDYPLDPLRNAPRSFDRYLLRYYRNRLRKVEGWRRVEALVLALVTLFPDSDRALEALLEFRVDARQASGRT